MALKLMFSNDVSIHARAKRAVQVIMQRAERFPDWPNTDIAFHFGECNQCGRKVWLLSDSYFCDECMELRHTQKLLAVELQRVKLEQNRELLARIQAGDMDALAEVGGAGDEDEPTDW